MRSEHVQCRVLTLCDPKSSPSLPPSLPLSLPPSAEQLKRPTEDLLVTDLAPLPPLHPMTWVVLPAPAFANLLMAVEFGRCATGPCATACVAGAPLDLVPQHVWQVRHWTLCHSMCGRCATGPCATACVAGAPLDLLPQHVWQVRRWTLCHSMCGV